MHEGIEDDITVFGVVFRLKLWHDEVKNPSLWTLRPVGLIDERTGKRPFAVVQLRKENAQGSLFNLVGFQTRLKWGEQRRVFRLIPALQEAEFVRYGVMHRNTFINAPKVLKATFQLKDYPNVFVAGQLTGVEGYVESSASGLLAGINAAFTGRTRTLSFTRSHYSRGFSTLS